MKLAVIGCENQDRMIRDKLLMCLKQHKYDVIFWDPYTKTEKHNRQDWIEEQFAKVDGMVFLESCDKVLHRIAPFVKSKKTDPAVLVLDPQGKFVISLLSGHIGGANELAQEISRGTGAIPVITTATDLSEKFAVDVFAKKNQCGISSMELAKEVSAALVNGDKVGFVSDVSWEGRLPQELVLWRENRDIPNPPLGFYVTISGKKQPFPHTLYLFPKIILLGIGCKKGTSEEVIEQVMKEVCEKYQISFQTIRQVASIDLKREESGLIAFCEKYNFPFVTFSREELLGVPGEFTASSFVKKITGVDNVCERSALLAGQKLESNCELIVKKYAKDGVTAALAIEKRSVYFE